MLVVMNFSKPPALVRTVLVFMRMTAFGNLRVMMCMQIRVSVGSNQGVI